MTDYKIYIRKRASISTHYPFDYLVFQVRERTDKGLSEPLKIDDNLVEQLNRAVVSVSTEPKEI